MFTGFFFAVEAYWGIKTDCVVVGLGVPPPEMFGRNNCLEIESGGDW